jgi:kynurenine formamidase
MQWAGCFEAHASQTQSDGRRADVEYSMGLTRRRLVFGFGLGGLLLDLRPIRFVQSTLAQGMNPSVPTKEEAAAWFTKRRNWGRWGADDEAGATNLITDKKRLEAAGLVKHGRTISLGRDFEPEEHRTSGGEGAVGDYYGFNYHGQRVTHLDALTHVWDQNGMWNGRDPKNEIDSTGTNFGRVTAFGNGIVTRGVLLDVPRFRKEPFVQMGKPVTGTELAAIEKAQRVEVKPGDALLIYSGREAYVRNGGSYSNNTLRPGVDLTATSFIRDRDVAIICWDMHDARPDPYGTPWPVHGVIFAYGVPLVDNGLLEPLAQACAQEGRYEFMFIALPLKVVRGTGSPVNPIAIL